MKRQAVRAGGAELAVFRLAADSPTAAVELVWAHGWGQSHLALSPLAQAMRSRASSVLVDLPGFGASPEPPASWGTADYAEAVAAWLAANPLPNPAPLAGQGRVGVTPARRIWVAHSFGCRVGLQLAARHPDALAGLFLIAAAGLKPARSPWKRGRMTVRRLAFRLARQFTPEGPARERLRARFGSSDYRQASPLMRQVLVKAVNEDLSEAARAIRVPAVLVYGDQDHDTPPEIGMRLNRLMPQSRLVTLRGFGHLDLLTDGQHQLVQRLGEFVEQIAGTPP